MNKKIVTYGLTSTDLEIARSKVKSQKKYLTDNEFITSNGQVKTLLDVSFSANLSYRYYAQLTNKINTLEGIGINENLHACFLTMTLDGFYRDFLKGDYKHLIYMTKEKRKEVFCTVPNNNTYGYIRNKIENQEKLTIKDLYKILMFQNKKYLDSYAFKKLRKLDKKYVSIRVSEPHKDGVPHFHMILFIPESMIDLFKKDFKKSFPAPRNSEPMRDKNKKVIPDTLLGFQTDINSASAYIMKYITKSFLDVKSGKELDYLNAWYVKHKIMRCVTSRSVLPQWIYQKISLLDKDWYYLTDILKTSNTDYQSEWSKENDYFYIYDNDSNRLYEYISGRLTLYVNGRFSKRVGKVIEKPYKMISYEKVPKKWINKKVDKVPIYKDGEIFSYFINGHIIKYKKHITDMNDIELYRYYTDYDVDNKDNLYQHYLAVQNELVTRGLLHNKLYNLNSFNFEEFILDDES